MGLKNKFSADCHSKYLCNLVEYCLHATFKYIFQYIAINIWFLVFFSRFSKNNKRYLAYVLPLSSQWTAQYNLAEAHTQPAKMADYLIV